MGFHFKVENVTNGYRLKFRKAEQEIANGNVVWLEGEEGFRVRNSTPAEMLAAMQKQANERELRILPDAEIRGFQFRPAPSGIKVSSMEQRLITAAAGFAAGQAGF